MSAEVFARRQRLHRPQNPQARRQSPATTRLPTPLPPSRPHAVVLNWEDVLAPTSILTARVGLRPSPDAVEHARHNVAADPYLQAALACIDDQILALLHVALKIGPVVVVTDTCLRYVELTCALFFPRVGAFLLQGTQSAGALGNTGSRANSVEVTAAPEDQWARTDWRRLLYERVCGDLARQTGMVTGLGGEHEHQHQQIMYLSTPYEGQVAWALKSAVAGRVALLSISALEQDSRACIQAVRSVAPFGIPKCVVVADSGATQNLKGFFAHLRTLQQYIDVAAAHTEGFSTRL